jgi:hypothetical protein
MIEVSQKSVNEYPTLKEPSFELQALIDSYEKRIAELNALILKLIEGREKFPETPAIPRMVNPPKPKIVTTSQAIKVLEEKTLKDSLLKKAEAVSNV